ncbi:hypothetical protein E6O75_ATG10464 [Venturia nashicola]|uniref:Uncharacterized protein n=1 Tax=Venturia nashicola TaxID=86259 RepID=A0A4Z1P174_9PEZI|nr:hypothetical protein E6O75_ATG10464 [Venturia nashicola]
MHQFTQVKAHLVGFFPAIDAESAMRTTRAGLEDLLFQMVKRRHRHRLASGFKFGLCRRGHCIMPNISNAQIGRSDCQRCSIPDMSARNWQLFNTSQESHKNFQGRISPYNSTLLRISSWWKRRKMRHSFRLQEPTSSHAQKTSKSYTPTNISILWVSWVPPPQLAFIFVQRTSTTRAVLEPKDMSLSVELANTIVSGIARPLHHYAPLKDMQPGPAGYLGLVFSNDKEGAEQRIACVHEHIEAFGMRRSVGWEGRLLRMRDRTCVSSLSYRVLRRWRGCL